MKREDILQKLDVDANGRVNLDDLLLLANGNLRKVLVGGFVAGVVVGVAACVILKAGGA